MIDISDIDPNWSSEDLINKIVDDANTEDFILYLSGIDEKAINRVKVRKESMACLKKINKILEQLEETR